MTHAELAAKKYTEFWSTSRNVLVEVCVLDNIAYDSGKIYIFTDGSALDFDGHGNPIAVTQKQVADSIQGYVRSEA